ncbi:site-specific integrase [bacterium]|nr:site-specific integrase [bacterium]
MNIVEPIRKKEHISEIETFLAKTNQRNRLIFAFGINTGLRVSDILALNIGDVKDKQNIVIREKKTGKYKKFPLNNKLKQLINEYLKNTSTHRLNTPLFLGDKGSRMHRSVVYRFLNEAVNTLNLDVGAIGTHTMRKTFGYHHYKKFNDVALLQCILNHSSPAITLRYIGISQEEIDISYSSFEL